jgi:hypothetical protein
MNTQEQIIRELKDIAPLLARHKQQYALQVPVQLPPFGECQSAVFEQLGQSPRPVHRLRISKRWLSLAAALTLLAPLAWWLLGPRQADTLSFEQLSNEEIIAYIAANPYEFDARQLEEVIIQERGDRLYLPPLQEQEAEALLEEVLLDMHDTDLESSLNY